MKTLGIKELSVYMPDDIQFVSELDKPYDEFGTQPKWTCNGVSFLFGEYCLMTKERSDAYPISKCKLILYSSDYLTKPIQHEGRGFVPIVELLKISLFNIYNYDVDIEIENIGNDDDSFGIVAYMDEKKYRIGFTYDRQQDFNDENKFNLHSFRLTINEGDMNLNQFDLFQKLSEWHINYLGIPNQLFINKAEYGM